jgi:hypothetical protein
MRMVIKFSLIVLLFAVNSFLAFFSQIVLSVSYETADKTSTQKIIQFVAEIFVYVYGFILYLAHLFSESFLHTYDYVESDLVTLSLMFINILFITYIQVNLFKYLKKRLSNNPSIQ